MSSTYGMIINLARIDAIVVKALFTRTFYEALN